MPGSRFVAFIISNQCGQVLGSRALREGHCDLRTGYNVRQRVTQHMQETGENLIERVFEQVTDEPIAAFPVQTSNLRMDSTLSASNIRQATRLQVLVEVRQRTQRMLDAADQQRYGDEVAPPARAPRVSPFPRCGERTMPRSCRASAR